MLTEVALVAAFICLPTSGQTPEEPARPRSYATQNTRLANVSTATLATGTTLLQDGLISTVGEEGSIPPAAWVIDGEGLTVYPGFIHWLSSLGLPASEENDREAKVSQGPQDGPATTPWRIAADQFRPKQRDLENWRNAGFTIAVPAPTAGIFPGYASVLNLGGATGAKSTVEPRTVLIARSPLGAVFGTRTISLGVDEFGQTGSRQKLCEHYGISKSAIIEAVESVIKPKGRR